MSKIKVDIVSAEAAIWSGEAEMIFAPGELGEFGVAPGHTALITRLVPGDVRVREADSQEEKVFFVSGGVIEVQPNAVIVLSDLAVRADELDEQRALEAKRQAEEALSDSSDDGAIDYAKVKVELAQAIAQIRSIRKMKRERS